MCVCLYKYIAFRILSWNLILFIWLSKVLISPKDKDKVQVCFRKGRGTRDQIANIHWIIEKAREFQKNIYFCFIDYAKAFDCVDHNKLWKTLKEAGIPDHLTCLLRNLYAGQEATVRNGHGTVMWVYVPWFFVSSQQRFGGMDIKPSARHSSRVLDKRCYSS